MIRPDLEDIAAWAIINKEQLPAAKREAFKARQAAVSAVAAGYTVSAAAKRYHLHPRTLALTLAKALEVAPDEHPWGWRACIPYRVRSNAKDGALETLPTKAGPGAFGCLLRVVPALEQMLLEYAGALPKRYLPAPAFESMFARWKKYAKELVPSGHYPLIAPDFARRSCLEFIKTQRTGTPFADVSFEVTDAEEASQFSALFAIPPCLWTQYDGHSKDCEFWIEGLGLDGKPFLQRISKVWLLLGFDVGARLVVSWRLSFTSNYSGLDLNRTCAQSLVDWEERDLIVPSMQYVQGSGIGTKVAIGTTVTGCITSLDNAMSHRLKVNREQLVEQLLGVINYGRAHVPEARAVLEAFFKRFEECAIRHLPGGYRPGIPGVGKKIPTTSASGKDYPVIIDALHDLMDVVLAGSNATEIAAHHERSPLQITKLHATGGGWMFATSNQVDRAAKLSRDSTTATIRGDRVKNRQPYVRFKNARYRSPSLKGRWDLLGKQFRATYDINDLRYLSLHDEGGELFVVLRALRPWSQTRHDLDLRKIITRSVNLGKFEIKGALDAIAAYRGYLRGVFSQQQNAAGEIARFESAFAEIKGHGTRSSDTPEASLAPQAVQTRPTETSKLYVPLSGPVILGRRKLP